MSTATPATARRDRQRAILADMAERHDLQTPVLAMFGAGRGFIAAGLYPEARAALLAALEVILRRRCRIDVGTSEDWTSTPAGYLRKLRSGLAIDRPTAHVLRRLLEAPAPWGKPYCAELFHAARRLDEEVGA